MTKFRYRALIGATALWSAASMPASVAQSQEPAITAPVAQTAQGTVVGRPDGLVDAFLGIPYAAPPVGSNRWRAPLAPATWTGPRHATDFGPGCIQQILPGGRPPWTHEYVVQGNVSEDCLTLNVWTPAHAGEKRPVLVWIHGGGFQEGSGSVPIYRGAALAGRGVVVVSINYRLGMFGFLAHPDITREAGGGVAGNFGLQDQIAALKWVRDNIAAFGGDPAQVTIAGQSAGSMAVHSLVVSPLAKSLFARAIAESGLPAIIPIPTRAQAEKNGLLFAHDKGATSLAQLRAMSVKQLAVPAGGGMGGKYQFGLVIDGKLLPAAPAEMIANGTFNDVPMIVGQNANEGSAFPGYGAGDAASYKAFMDRSFGDKVSAFEAFYPSGSDAERSASAKLASGDRGLALIDSWTGSRLGKGKAKVWGYYFTHVEPGAGSEIFGAFHSSEIPYVLSTLDAAPERSFTLADRTLSLLMSSYWLNFVKNGDPNGADLTRWTSIDHASPMILLFGDTPQERPLLSSEKLRAYRAYVAAGGALSMF